MGKRYLSNARTRVPPMYVQQLARVERELQKVKRRLDLERAIRLHEIEKQNFSDKTNAAAVEAAAQAVARAKAIHIDAMRFGAGVAKESEFIQRNVNARRAHTLEALLDEHYPEPRRPLWRRIYSALVTVAVAVAGLGVGIVVGEAITWVLRHVD